MTPRTTPTEWRTEEDMLTFPTRPCLLIGQAPARSASPDTRPWESQSGRNLERRMGLEPRLLLELFDTTNLNYELRGTKGKYDAFLPEEADERARVLLMNLDRWDFVACCGLNVGRHMGVGLYEWAVIDITTIITCRPHDGGTNRHWNDATNRLRGEHHARQMKNLARLAWDAREGRGEWPPTLS